MKNATKIVVTDRQTKGQTHIVKRVHPLLLRSGGITDIVHRLIKYKMSRKLITSIKMKLDILVRLIKLKKSITFPEGLHVYKS